MTKWIAVAFAATSLVAGTTMADQPADVILRKGLPDASAVVVLDERLFVVANDEQTILGVYDREKPEALKTIPLWELLGFQSDDEGDIEGAAMVQGLSFWIGSHGANKDGERSKKRERFFALKLEDGPTGLTAKLSGKPCKSLQDAIIAHEPWKGYHFADAVKKPPKDQGGFNIEGLAVWKETGVLIGLRNPLTEDGKAILLPLLNPVEVTKDKPPRFGDAIELDLGGLGIRDIVYVPGLRGYLISAGPRADGECKLYRWNVQDDPELVSHVDLDGWGVEGLALFPGQVDKAMVIADDGKKPKPETFRTGWVSLIQGGPQQ